LFGRRSGRRVGGNTAESVTEIEQFFAAIHADKLVAFFQSFGRADRVSIAFL
jgi:hypothetical protein